MFACRLGQSTLLNGRLDDRIHFVADFQREYTAECSALIRWKK
jgi:hypothetical protein